MLFCDVSAIFVQHIFSVCEWWLVCTDI